MSSFDPYSDWLGIRDAERPLDFYQLLELDRFENDPRRIAAAVERGIAIVKRHEHGSDAAHATVLLAELAAARSILLRPEKKYDYDLRIRQKAAKSGPVDMSEQAVGETFTRDPHSSGGDYATGRRSSGVGIWLFIIALVVLIGGLTWALKNRFRETLAKNANPTVPPEVVKTAPPEKIEKSNPANKNPIVKSPAAEQPEVRDPDSDTSPMQEAPLEPPPIVPPVAQPPAARQPVEVDENPQLPAAPRTAPIVKQPVPDEALRAVRLNELRAIYPKEYAARDTAGHADLAAKLLRAARNSRSDAAATFVLFEEALFRFALAGDAANAFVCAEELTERFEFALDDVHYDALGRMANIPGQSAEAPREVFTAILRQANRAYELDDYETAGRLAQVALGMARKGSPDTATTLKLSARIKELSYLKERYAKAQTAERKLRSDPTDRNANAEWGTFLCLTKGNFERGLPFMAAGDGETFAPLARRTLAAKSPTELVAAADGWWNSAENQRDYARQHTRRFAASLYQKALPELEGLTQLRAEKRIAEAASGAP